MGGLLSLFKRQDQASDPKPSTLQEMLPAIGSVAPCLFSRNKEMVHAMCKVEERDETSLLLRVMREVGKVTLAGLKVGEEGHIETADRQIPMHVVQVQLPWITVATSPERSRSVKRQFFRVPATFTVRFRQQSPQAPWLVGKGTDLSSGGFRFVFRSRELPRLGTVYLTELTISLARSQQTTLEMPAEVRWVGPAGGETAVGVQVTDAAHRKDLANIVSQLQRLMVHQPEDYLLTETQRPRLRP